MKSLDYPTRVALRSFASVEWANRTISAEEVGAGELELSARTVALNTLLNLGLVAAVEGGYILTYEGTQELERLQRSWIDEPRKTESARP